MKFPFDDLSGGEFRARLEQRELHEEVVEIYLDHRNNCEGCRTEIAFFLGEDPTEE